MNITVDAGLHMRSWCPVRVHLPTRPVESLCLREETSEQIVPCQVRQGKDGWDLFWIVDALPAGTSRTYRVEQLDTAPSPGVQVQEMETQVEIWTDGSLFTRYHYSPEYARPFLYPIAGPFGHGVTRNYPMIADLPGESNDHPHHRSLYTAFGEVNGVDDWSEMPGHGRIVHRRFSALEGGPVYGHITAENDWVSRDGECVVTETREMTFYRTPATCRLIDYAVTFHAGDEAVTFGDTKEGGMLSVRVASSMDVQRGLGGQITNAYGGINEGETWGKPSPWCDYSGPVAGRTVGIAVLDHPDNLRYPTQWHVRDYGLMTANCFAWSYYKADKSLDGSYTMPPHSDLTFRYRVYVHPGGVEHVPGRFLDFVCPPQVRVET